MKIVLQRIKNASVYLVDEGKYCAKIENGILALIGFCKEDINKNQNDYIKIARKILNLRIFEDNQRKMNLSLWEIKGRIIIVSQFTLCADPYKGNRPSFGESLDINLAEKLYMNFIKFIKHEYYNIFLEKYNEEIRDIDFYVQTGKFQSNMEVQLINDGPVTFLLEYN